MLGEPNVDTKNLRGILSEHCRLELIGWSYMPEALIGNRVKIFEIWLAKKPILGKG